MIQGQHVGAAFAHEGDFLGGNGRHAPAAQPVADEQYFAVDRRAGARRMIDNGLKFQRRRGRGRDNRSGLGGRWTGRGGRGCGGLGSRRFRCARGWGNGWQGRRSDGWSGFCKIIRFGRDNCRSRCGHTGGEDSRRCRRAVRRGDGRRSVRRGIGRAGRAPLLQTLPQQNCGACHHHGEDQQQSQVGMLLRLPFHRAQRRAAGRCRGILSVNFFGPFEGVVDEAHAWIFPSNSRTARPIIFQLMRSVWRT